MESDNEPELPDDVPINPNDVTVAAIIEARNGNLTSVSSISELFEELDNELDSNLKS